MTESLSLYAPESSRFAALPNVSWTDIDLTGSIVGWIRETAWIRFASLKTMTRPIGLSDPPLKAAYCDDRDDGSSH